jgi:hypothetical protein
MPGGDRTGPLGMGPRTGRMAGFCAGYDAPGYMNPIPGWGAGFGAGHGGRGGRAWRAGWGRRLGPGWGWRGYALAETSGSGGPQAADQGTLEQRLEQLQAELSEIRRLIGEPESSQAGGQGK